ncbi:hypothetical protein N1851_015455 [Merluccius polli]|uniref:Uncharacterized protein n=1 Tax=Merluccius polli TaxID=89951 RepID=A0AA47P263_MERPO|nr:hypothetical protein N1851_015455 [Merluccius polli]
MNGKNKGVQARLLVKNPHVLLVVADAAKNSIDATSFFGNVQKSWSETRWESRVNSFSPLRYQASGFRNALFEVREKATDAKLKPNLWQRRLGYSDSRFAQLCGMTSSPRSTHSASYCSLPQRSWMSKSKSSVLL